MAAAIFGLVLAGPSVSTALAAWSIEPTQNQPLTTNNVLQGVSCPAAQMCVSVGYDGLSSTGPVPAHRSALAEHWDGHSWSIYRTTVSPSGITELSAVSCTTRTWCIAVGDVTGRPRSEPLAERWNGKTWSVMKTPGVNRGFGAALFGISCTSKRNCVAVGRDDGGATGRSLVERYNGHKWKVEARLRAPFRGSGSFESVSCSSRSSCIAVGTDSIIGPDEVPFTARWNGRNWKVIKAQNAPSARATAFHGVSCVSRHACIAVGDALHGVDGPVLAVAERWNGRKWSLSHLANPNPPQNPNGPSSTSGLNSVSCVSSRACVAVGEHNSGGPTYETLVERFNGHSWSVVPSPNPAGNPTLLGVSCLVGPACTAVGDYETSGSTLTLAEGG